MAEVKHLTTAELEAGLEHIRQSPENNGTLELIVIRPAVGERAILSEGRLDLELGLVGDTWKARGSSYTADGSSEPNKQLNIMNSRAVALVAQDKSRWPLAGDQLYIDIDLSTKNLRPGTRLAIGEAVIEVSPEPHNGCKKFTTRFGIDAVRFVNSPVGKQLHLRGVNAKIVQPGVIRVGDVARKI
jgi:hypothetical protein